MFVSFVIKSFDTLKLQLILRPQVWSITFLLCTIPVQTHDLVAVKGCRHTLELPSSCSWWVYLEVVLSSADHCLSSSLVEGSVLFPELAEVSPGDFKQHAV